MRSTGSQLVFCLQGFNLHSECSDCNLFPPCSIRVAQKKQPPGSPENLSLVTPTCRTKVFYKALHWLIHFHYEKRIKGKVTCKKWCKLAAGSSEEPVKGPFLHWTHNDNNKRPATLDWTNIEKKNVGKTIICGATQALCYYFFCRKSNDSKFRQSSRTLLA